MLSEAFAILKKSSESTPVATITDECQSFANFIADKLRTYSAQKRAEVQQAICNVVFSADLGYSDATYNYTAFPQPTTRFSPSSGTYNENYYPNHPGPSVHTPILFSPHLQRLLNNKHALLPPQSHHQQVSPRALIALYVVMTVWISWIQFNLNSSLFLDFLIKIIQKLL
jgi:hypothetical protein